MLPCLACFNFNGLGDPYRGFCNFCDSGCDEPAEPVVVRRCHSAGNTRGCLNKLCLIHSEISDVVCELNVTALNGYYGPDERLNLGSWWKWGVLPTHNARKNCRSFTGN